MTPTQFAAKTRNLAKSTGLNAQLVQRHFMMDRLIEQISESKYKNDFILKGGFLLGSKYGIDRRTTIDIDTTFRNSKLTEEKLKSIFNDLTRKPTKEGIVFSIQGMKETREADFYPGFQIKLVANLEKVRVPFKMDVTTGDSIYPEVDTHYHQLMFEDKKVEIPAYPTEQIIAEKLSATFSFGTDNSRAKDYYDLFTIPKLENIDTKELYKSVRNTFTKRGDTKSLSFYYEREMDKIRGNDYLEKQWEKYRSVNTFANSISFADTVNEIDHLMKSVIKIENQERKRQFKRSQQMNQEMER
ncbi:nucleotidyl transferase AbiEii/AbiGii toxin family protein [Enterococcus faecium]|uniref:nucleotidyl transferase AbiEii/AbiGii toxin family protein n=1 Tax=Enterococcus faecium TaxID=1352 RepID=UPI002DBC88FE|nr:nucleotidyl transferase AbiEii/AbiGii toxin family protein [Enterococcus faecium]MEB6015931.1 nucleotidyl transferase AbiEii/AbiGii toxin family protein [Enterococcus faecium]